MSYELLPWWVGLALLAAYLGLFAVRRDVAPRPAVVAGVVAAAVLARTALLPLGWSVVDWSALGLSLAALTGLYFLRAHRLVHARVEEVRGEVDEACRRLFLPQEEVRPGHLLLTAKGMTRVVRLRACGPFTVIGLPRTPGAGKLALFFGWLSKRYPGPVPRIRIVLTRR